MVGMLLSIVVPSYNRAHNIPKLLDSLYQDLPQFIWENLEIVISDNHSNPKIEIPNAQIFEELVKIVKPSKHLLTAEENLAFALGHASGEYCWVLGDDDEILKNGVRVLLEQISENKYDLMIFNSLGFDLNSSSYSISRLELDKVVSEFHFIDFVKRAGFWSVTSGFSTLVFRRRAFDLNFLRNLHSENLVIYSHVTTLVKSFYSLKFAVIAIPLVNYATNSFDDEPVDSVVKNQHWVEYGQKSHGPFRYPWTSSFLSQIKKLDALGIFSFLDLYEVLDQGHLGGRFFLVDTVLAMFIDQILHEQNNPSELEYTVAQSALVLTSLEGYYEEFDHIINSIREFVEAKNGHIELKKLQSILIDPNSQLKRRFVMRLSGGNIYRTPYGLFWSPYQVLLDHNFSNLSSPSSGLVASNLDQLELKILDLKELHPFIFALDPNLESALAIFHKILELESALAIFHKILERVPLFMKKILKGR